MTSVQKDEVYSNLLALEKVGKDTNGSILWRCRCACGNITTVRGSHLVSGHTTSCGCLRDVASSKTHFIHGDTKKKKNSPYTTWANMKQRCSDLNHPDYYRYGGRGIKVCADWQNYQAFKSWAILHGWHKELTIDRIDNNGNYEPVNCRFITQAENSRKRHMEASK